MIRIPFYLNEIEGWKEFYIDRRKSAEIILKSFLILILSYQLLITEL